MSRGFALISNPWLNAGGASWRRSQCTRLAPVFTGSPAGFAIQKFGAGGRAASGTGVIAALVRWRTTLPFASSTSSTISPTGFAVSQ